MVWPIDTFANLSASCPHPCLAVAERHSLDVLLVFDSDAANLLETNANLQ